ncbi:MAG: alkaline phosphatase [Bacteroidetes bacterium]|nr:alkaline phosphatase [Bacteroidota bacterium]
MHSLLLRFPLLLLVALLFLTASCSDAERAPVQTGSVIFIHPDGSGGAMWTAMRLMEYGPDGFSEWDRLDHLGQYRSHQRNSVSTSSHAGATVHAFGVKVDVDTYGSVPAKPVRSASGEDVGIMIEALKAGKAVAVINSGHLCEPGTGVFLASAFSRYAMDSISAQIVESGADIILGGGEVMLLPAGVIGRHGEEGRRKDGRNLIDRAKDLGYTVVFTRDELLALPDTVSRVFGVFAAYHTFNDMPEEALADRGLPQYWPEAPTLAEMTEKSLQLLEKKGKDFLLVIEEEGSDNFANENNAAGAIEALRRADQAIGVARRFVETHSNTLLITAADSDAGSIGIHPIGQDADPTQPLPPATDNGAPMDGLGGTATPPFIARADAFGRRLPFGIAWSSDGDMGAGVIARAHGANAHLLPTNVDNTDIYRLVYLTLFGTWPDGSVPSP